MLVIQGRKRNEDGISWLAVNYKYKGDASIIYDDGCAFVRVYDRKRGLTLVKDIPTVDCDGFTEYVDKLKLSDFIDFEIFNY